jgi:hypothetical protein
MESAQVHMNRLMDKENVVHLYNGVLFHHKKYEIMLFGEKWMELEMIILSKISQSHKDKYSKFSFLSRIRSKKDMNVKRRLLGIWNV